MKRAALCLFLLALAWAAPPALLGANLPPGTELRLLSPDLKTLYGAWRVEGGRLVPLSPPLAPERGQRVQLLVNPPGGRPLAFQGLAERGDVFLLTGEGRVSLILILREVYGLNAPLRLWPLDAP